MATCTERNIKFLMKHIVLISSIDASAYVKDWKF